MNLIKNRIVKLILLRPLSYLLVENKELRRLSFELPGIATAVFLTLYYFSPGINVFDNGGLVQSISSFLERLTGFYIASLAAIATFQSPYLDEQIRGKGAFLDSYIDGRLQKESLTRRRFLCLLFGYCSFSSIIIFLIGMFSHLYENAAKVAVPMDWHQLVVAFFLSFYMFLFFHLVVTTFLGLSYLTDRIVSRD